VHAYLSSLKLMICGPYHKDSFYIKISKNPSRVGRVIKGHYYWGSSLLWVIFAFLFSLCNVAGLFLSK
jgi:hypothetical protein